jgi:hypothetical protein
MSTTTQAVRVMKASARTAQVVTIEEGRLEALAAPINDRWHAVRKADTEGRVAVGLMLIAAKEQVENSGPDWVKISWEKWCALNIERSMSDINRVMALARSPDPLAALEEERKKRRGQMAAHRAKRQHTAAAVANKDAQVGADAAEDTSSEEPKGREEPEQATVTEITLSGTAFSKVPLDRLCFASFREEIINAKRVAIICVPKEVNEAVQIAALKHLFDRARPGARTQFRQWAEAGREPEQRAEEEAAL